MTSDYGNGRSEVHHPEIVVLSHTGDEHALAFLTALNPDYGVILLDVSKLGIDYVAKYDLASGLQIRTRDGRIYCFDRVRFWWNRRPRIETTNSIDQRYIRFREVELEAFWRGFFYTCQTGFWCNDFWSQERCNNKIYQLQLAGEVGLNTPETTWTNSPFEATVLAEKFERGAVVKMHAGTEALWQPCRELDKVLMSKSGNFRFAPAIFQEFLQGSKEYRVTMFGNECFVAMADMRGSRYPHDVRIDLSVSRVEDSLDATIVSKLSDFMKAAGLSFAAFDLREDSDGKVTFLEVNPAGQFLYLEKVHLQSILGKFCEFAVSHCVPDGEKVESDFHNRSSEVDFQDIDEVPIYVAADSWVKHF
ncbi:hypothetical protein N8I71_04890 [Roseibacterium sp. SDUM158016]|uniref:ATP-grasp domain-containing protein n=1 Tax=Roseicyclus sediminis TaxID=2980997 RepID=UPI0021D359DF|nr:hypothetical protein [Roseibacterium sp. SDUM158016]MCU4652153.1 hypothetical protein [Roseibacterium sp. SDUM158016]